MATALITGATAGLGRAVADKLAAERHDLVLVARDEARLDKVADEVGTRYGVSCEVLAADLLDDEQRNMVEERVADSVDVLVNNAGFGQPRAFWDTTAEEQERQLDLLVRVVLRLTHAAVRPMMERHAGAIVNVSSTAGFAHRGPYSAHKAWVPNFSEGVAMELRPHGVRVMALCPGWVHTEFHQRMGVDMSSVPSFMWLNAPEVAAEAWDDLRKGKSLSIPSLRYKLLIGASRVTPSSVVDRVSRIGLARIRRSR